MEELRLCYSGDPGIILYRLARIISFQYRLLKSNHLSLEMLSSVVLIVAANKSMEWRKTQLSKLNCQLTFNLITYRLYSRLSYSWLVYSLFNAKALSLSKGLNNFADIPIILKLNKNLREPPKGPLLLCTLEILNIHTFAQKFLLLKYSWVQD